MQSLLLSAVEEAESSQTLQYRVSCREHLCKQGGSEHTVPFPPSVYCQTSILVFHLCVASLLQTVLFKSNFNPISWPVLIWLRLIPICRLDAHSNRILFDGIQFACQYGWFLLLKPNNTCARATSQL